MANFKIITNNPMVSDKYPELAQFYGVAVDGIFIAVRDAVHKGAILISHPLSGSVKPNESPYKSLVVSYGKPQTDFFSLQLIEGALAVFKKLVKKNIHYSDSVLEDFQVIDLDLLDSALLALPHEYYR